MRKLIVTTQERIAKAKQKIQELETLLNEDEYSDAELVCEYLEHAFAKLRSVLTLVNEK